MGEEEVLVGVFDASGKQQRVASAFDKDGGVWWKQEVKAGQPTFEQVYLANRCVDMLCSLGLRFGAPCLPWMEGLSHAIDQPTTNDQPRNRDVDVAEIEGKSQAAHHALRGALQTR